MMTSLMILIMFQVKDAKDREIILLETELRKVRLEKDKQILELKEEIKKLETMKRSEIAASKRDLQVLLEQQEKNWKTKFFVNSSENVLEAPPTHPSEYRGSSSQSSTAKNSKLNPLVTSLASDTVDISQGYRPSYQAPDSSMKLISSPFASSSSQKTPPGGGGAGTQSGAAPQSSSTSKQSTSQQSGESQKPRR